MKKIFQVALFAGLVLLLAQSAAMAAAAKVAVLPFTINAPGDMGFLRDGIQDMLGSRLSWEDKVVVIDREAVNQAVESVTGFKGQNLALMVGAKLSADYVVYGSLTMIGENASIDAKVVDVAGKSEPTSIYKQTDTVGQVIPEINKFATDINTKVFKRPAAPGFEETQPAARYAYPNQNAIIPSGMAAGAMMSSGGRLEFWKSRDYDCLITGMAFGDVNNDGINEIVYVSDQQVFVTYYVNGALAPALEIAKTRVNTYIGVDVADINQNGTPEIFVSGLTADENEVSSYVFEYDGAGYKEIVTRSPYVFRVVKPVNGDLMLIGQRQEGKKGGVFASKISVMAPRGDTYSPERVLLRPGLSNALGVTVDDLDANGSTTVIAYDKNDYLQLFSGESRPNWKGTDKLGGSMSRFLITPEDPTGVRETQYFPVRVGTYDSNGDGKPEVITPSSHDKVMDLVDGFRVFSKTRIQALSWDSLGIFPAWQTRDLNGRISDFFIEDFDDDGVMELVVSLVKEEKGALMDTGAQSTIVAYELGENLKEK